MRQISMEADFVYCVLHVVAELHQNRSIFGEPVCLCHREKTQYFFVNATRPTHLVFSVCSKMGFLIFRVFSLSSFIRNIVTSLFCIVGNR